MSISKEEREWWRKRLHNLGKSGESQVSINIYSVSDALNQLDANDSTIAELQREIERLRRYMDYEPKESK